jgi:hypothetical protein
MPREFGERPCHERRSPRHTHQEAEHVTHDRLAPLMGDEKAWSERSHEEMVDILRSSMVQYRVERDPESRWFDPVDWMREQLCFEMAKKSVAMNQGETVDVTDMPHAKLLLAWEIISQPYMRSKFNRDHVEVAIRDKVRILGRTVTLDPNESRLLDAMADACGIPQQGEQEHG